MDGTKVVSFVAWEQGEPEDTPTKRCVYQWTNSSMTIIDFWMKKFQTKHYTWIQKLKSNLPCHLYVDRWYTTNCNAKLTNGVVCMKQNGSSEVITTPSTPMQPWGCPPGYIESRVSKSTNLQQQFKQPFCHISPNF